MMKDLILLAADKNMEFTLRGALHRHQALEIREITFEVMTHPGRDGGVHTNGPDFLELHSKRFSHGVLMLDYEGSGAAQTREKLEAELDERLRSSWNDRAKAIVIEPEVDVWMWGTPNKLEQMLEWNNDGPRLVPWLEEKGYVFTQQGKPKRPKEALEHVLRHTRQPRSSDLYKRIASQLSLSKCTDSAFCRFRDRLRQWFPNNA
jgi:hypothetical protein